MCQRFLTMEKNSLGKLKRFTHFASTIDSKEEKLHWRSAWSLEGDIADGNKLPSVDHNIRPQTQEVKRGAGLRPQSVL